MSNITSFFSDNSGEFSMMRLVYFVWGIGIFTVWAYTCINTGGIITIPTEIITLFLGLSTAKVVQRGLEKPETTTTI
jgi:hypothetical protein